ncbi:cell wall protein SED1-like isoform X2 [Perca fluviatilis]|uniref:cell wall protein SED1-like isoform X2 n=1 Tax=Perca fluviatilis TaxID=8168 RepID=UPI001962A7FF|nr:cell wall protein SED1-like isoform X2 [Perca fluviatilis]
MTAPTWSTGATPAHAALSTAAQTGATLSEVLTEMVTTKGMDISMTPAPDAMSLPPTIEAWTRLPPSLVTEAVTKAAETGATLSEVWTKMVTTGMGIHTTAAPPPTSLPPATEAWTRLPLPLVTEAVTKAETGATLSEVWTEMVTEGMGIPTTPAPAPAALPPATEVWTRLPLVTEAVTKGIALDDGAFAALIGGIVCIALLLVICIIVLLLWHLSRHKGSYVTNEMDDDEMDDEESVGSDTALQSREPLETKEDA